ncbi:nucleotidyltransferase [Butyrivibrio proteoclasticus]|uniref:nucleotidyltransferase n=1 Tax=Butyrivibrio proteoclasticus TaxID=43305 RepID=UPI00047E0221|nr:nucleotidyltransferase [Butyrivibrio proteoclasticus]
MKTIGIIAEFNPFHNGHSYLIEQCKKDLNADFCVVVMSGDFVQRGAPAIIDKFTRTRMALSCGADLVIELPIYYSTGSAEFFASGAVSILDKLGVVDYLCFGSECGDVAALSEIADILASEPQEFKDALAKELRNGASFPKARQNALMATVPSLSAGNAISDIMASPNNILGIEYLKALKLANSSIKPYTITRAGEGYHSDALNELSSASAIREAMLSGKDISGSIPEAAHRILVESNSNIEHDNSCNNSHESSDTVSKPFATTNDFSQLLLYKLLSESSVDVLSKYLDVSSDLAQKILNNVSSFTTFDEFAMALKSKDLSYARISRSLIHILLGITDAHMEAYKYDDYTAYARVLGLKKSSSKLLSSAHEASSIPIIDRLKDSEKLLSPLQMSLLDETLYASKVYSLATKGTYLDEYKLKQIVD